MSPSQGEGRRFESGSPLIFMSSAETPPLTYDAIQAEAEAFAAQYRQTHEVPALPSDEELRPYVELLAQYPLVRQQVTEYTSAHDPEGGHGIEHLEWVSARAGWIAENEVKLKKLDEAKTAQIVLEAVLAGYLHDIDRHLGFGQDHMDVGSQTAHRILTAAGLDLPRVVEVVGHHDLIDYQPGDDELAIIFGSVFDADHFRYGLEREDTLWRMKEKQGKTAEAVIHDYAYLPQYREAWRTAYGKKVGPLLIDFALAISKHIEKTFAST
jgi:hypothetical protein